MSSASNGNSSETPAPAPAPVAPVWSRVSPPSGSLPPRILSIQSSVVFGYVGNKASVFPLQLLGFDVDPLNSCQFSNHTGYGRWAGEKTKPQEFQALTNGLIELNLFPSHYSHLLTGYMASVEFLTAFAHFLPRFLPENRDFLENPGKKREIHYFCDPVLGDNGKLYVPEEFIPIYRDSILKYAYLITPNATEAEYLSGRPTIENLQEAKEICQFFHQQMGIPYVVITSLKIKNTKSNDSGLSEDRLYLLASQRGTADGENQCHLWEFEQIPGYWSGTGDLTASLILGWFLRENGNFLLAIEKAISTVQAVLRKTQKLQTSEIALIQSKREIEQPETNYKGKKI